MIRMAIHSRRSFGSRCAARFLNHRTSGKHNFEEFRTKSITVDELREEIEDMMISELLDDAIGFSKLFEKEIYRSGENWSAKGYSSIGGETVAQFSGNLVQELFLGHVRAHREMTVRGANWQVDVCVSDTLGADGEPRGAGTVDLNISPSSDIWVLGEIHETLEEMIENL